MGRVRHVRCVLNNKRLQQKFKNRKNEDVLSLFMIVKFSVREMSNRKLKIKANVTKFIKLKAKNSLQNLK
jgi:hypothetical protein